MSRWHIARVAVVVAVLAALVGLTATWAVSAVFGALSSAGPSESQSIAPGHQPASRTTHFRAQSSPAGLV